VPNHTSDQHPWFLESRSSLTNPKRELVFVARSSPRMAGPPNNWLSNFGGPAWTMDGGQYYYHSLFEAQPDVNWRNPELRAAMFNVLRFWAGPRGSMGFAWM